MKVIDSFIFFNEIELLKIRLDLLYDSVDHFVICESDTTFTGKPKELNFLRMQHEFTPWLDKIIYTVHRAAGAAAASAWDVEVAQRNHIASELLKFDDDDVAMLTDVDEIWDPEVVAPLARHPGLPGGVRLLMKFHYFYLNCRGVGPANTQWLYPFCARISTIRSNPDLHQLRTSGEMPALNHAGWHFSYLGGAQKFVEKLDAFSHQELNTEEFRNLARIESSMRLGKDPFGRPDHEWAFHPVDYYPARLAGLMRRNASLVRHEL